MFKTVKSKNSKESYIWLAKNVQKAVVMIMVCDVKLFRH